ncbi:glycosyltransferase [Riemerella anatipestifer]|uniref:glycosyltransferase n=1 Tax=Riemerella anatipestifer TaxID=34085 RepID=UPI0001F0E24D|nr:glycosyltransferase [Riemerella anatipestifer]ADZ12588.1 glycosyltransferase [Riemerella anatipestifer RA-GD]AGC40176.1 hypothetical protein G148_0872 [Riemerella anatipestifer RA-CH-2]AKP71023.1 glycosyltransferase [Riemerella anatipestifer]AKQ39503.1 glycosyl transferase [Riemerella anatipestifer Yb2]EFT36088.1 glycosyltransferase [Riemerella anatipestifer RA-YM]
MKKVLFIVHDINAGGIENYLLRFLRFYDGKIIPTVLCKSGALGVLEKEYQQIQNITLVPFKLVFFDVGGYWRFYHYLRKHSFDTVVDFGGNFAGLSMLIGKWAGIDKRITFYRGASNHFKETTLKLLYNDFLNRIVYRYATSVLSNSKSAFSYFFKNKIDHRFQVIYNGIQSESFLNDTSTLRDILHIPKEAFVVSHVGRFTKEKNHQAIIEVASVLCHKYSNIYFVLCGKEVDTSLKDSLVQKNLQEKVKLLPFRKDVVKVLNSSQLFYFPSYTEGQPNALIEAMVAGLAFVTSSIDPIKETVSTDFHHLLVEPDDVRRASEMIEFFYLNPDKLETVNLSSWAIEQYDAQTQFDKFYKKL